MRTKRSAVRITDGAEEGSSIIGRYIRPKSIASFHTTSTAKYYSPNCVPKFGAISTMGNSASTSSNKPTAELDRTISGVKYKVVFDPTSFDKGACRHAFKGTYKGDGPMNGKPCVAKIFIDEAQRHYKNYKPDLKASHKANEFAKDFNSAYSSTKPLRFIVPELATVERVPKSNEYAKPGDKIVVEDFIEGHYEKFNSNNGYCRDEVAAIPTFCHYTYDKSDGEFLVCDIQGVRSPNGYLLTDPAVLSRRQGQYGPTDTGPKGMTKFFSTHKCTSICSQFPTPTFNGARKINRGRHDRRASSYTFMLDAKEIEANKYFEHRKDLPAIEEE